VIPKIVLHKKNGHSHAPAAPHASLGAILREVHAGGEHAPRPTFDLLKFATVVRSEKRAALLEQSVHQVDGLASALTGLLARTEEALSRGELGEVRAMLEARRAPADGATRLFARLLASAETRTSAHGLVNVNHLVADAVARARAQATGAVVASLDPAAPAVFGTARRLEHALVTFVAALASSGAVAVAAAQVDGVIRGEKVVRLEVSGDGSLPMPAAVALGLAAPLAEPVAADLDMHLARQIVAEHGGAVWAGPGVNGGTVIRIELPAV
jgi:ADP-ribose pyrophosphatase YjhB (NUDIX family)